MEIAFHTRELRSLCTSPTIATKKLGRDVATALRAALADVEAAANPEELPTRAASSSGTSIEFQLPLVAFYFAVFASNHNRDREAPPGMKIDWRRVNRVKLMGIIKEND